jgi:signal transduction histidine kinase
LKFTAPGTPPGVVIDAVYDGASCRLQVTDNGIGVPEGEQERIFAPFHRAHLDEELRGSGLGLAICRRVAEQHGGRIWVEPAPGGGSRFSVVLPLG